MRTLDEAVEALPISVEYPCGYFPDRKARQQSFYWDEEDDPFPEAMYQALMDRRFRRSGRMVYRPTCDTCSLCVPIRIDLNTFNASRSQLRSVKKNPDVEVVFGAPVFSEEKIALYTKYGASRHDKSEDPGPRGEELRAFLYDSPTTTIEGEFRVDGRLVGVSICDVTEEALSAVYFYFDPEESARSLGVFSAMHEIAQARSLGCQFYYLGYWIEGCRKMDYKAAFADHELLIAGEWQKRTRR